MKKLGVLSGKGGTGKTTIAVSLALGLAREGYAVGLIDVDLTGPNALDILGNHPIDVVEDQFVPAEASGIKYISLGHIASKEDPVLWSGKDFRSAARQLLERTVWAGLKDSELDYLIFDFPPGSGGEVQEMLPLMDAVLLVTVPSHLSESNVRRCVEMCRETEVPIIGLIKNMTHFECECGRKTQIFPEDHSFVDMGIPVMAEIPLKRSIAEQKRIPDLPVKKIIAAKPILLKRRRIKRHLLKAFAKAFLRG